jgi:hypothetical protein
MAYEKKRLNFRRTGTTCRLDLYICSHIFNKILPQTLVFLQSKNRSLIFA